MMHPYCDIYKNFTLQLYVQPVQSSTYKKKKDMLWFHIRVSVSENSHT